MPTTISVPNLAWETSADVASKQKKLVVAEGWSHYDLHDKPEPVGQTLTNVIPFFKEHLSATVGL